MKLETTNEWFLSEKAEISKILANDLDDVCIETFITKARKRIKNDSRSALERGLSRDIFGKALLDLMRSVQTIKLISHILNKDFGLNLEPQQYADIARNMFVHEYDTYLRRLYLFFYDYQITLILVKYCLKPVKEKFLRFLSENKSICPVLGVTLEDFVFCANNPVFGSGFSPVQRAVKMINAGAQYDGTTVRSCSIR
ncbi:MAG: hypothetical protein PHO62_10930 [Sulfurimonas sp.]|uniref:hypothetical protein n=1 Tax=Sulfurimonas sp. TaxID=2022749 RepID=UPI0026106CD8|nr:hypothetical protein [Sulfurimonas sp.]MDD5373924.1 hypothetical protein [Sulfurimonas sp.]